MYLKNVTVFGTSITTSKELIMQIKRCAHRFMYKYAHHGISEKNKKETI